MKVETTSNQQAMANEEALQVEDATLVIAEYPVTIRDLIGDASRWTSDGIPGVHNSFELVRAPDGTYYDSKDANGELSRRGPYSPDTLIGTVMFEALADTGVCELNAMLDELRGIWNHHVHKPVTDTIHVSDCEVCAEINATFAPGSSDGKMHFSLHMPAGQSISERDSGCADVDQTTGVGGSLHDVVMGTLKANADQILSYLAYCVERSIVLAAKKKDD